jgi:hypothetical protein
VFKIDATRSKLAEAEFFFQKLTAEAQKVISNEPEAFEFYLSAFLSAARSVTFVLQAEQKEKYDTWFKQWRETLPNEENELLDYANEQRVQAVHRMGPQVEFSSEALSMPEFLLAGARQGMRIEIHNGPLSNPPPQFQRLVRNFEIGGTKSEVAHVCEKYLAVVSNLVTAFAARFSDEVTT